MSRYQKGKTNLDCNGARDSEWQWHQLGPMQVCTSLQTDNHASTPPLSFLQAGCPSCRPTNSVKALSLVPVKFRLVLPFWYRLTRVVPDKGPLDGCVCVYVCVCECGYSALSSRTANALDALVSRVLYCTWSYHFTPIICRWQLLWKDCSLYEIHRGNGLLRGALSGPLWCIRNSRRAPKLLAKSRSCQR